MKRAFRITILFTLVFGLLATNFSLPSPAGAYPPSYSDLRTDGETIVWEVAGSSGHELHGRSVDGSVGLSAQGIYNADVSGDRLVGVGEDAKLRGISLSTRDLLDLPSATVPDALDANPVLDGDRLVWLNKPGSAAPWRILTIDLSGAAAPTVVATLPDNIATDYFGPTHFSGPTLGLEVSGDHIIWAVDIGERYFDDYDPNPDYRWELWSARIGMEPILIVSGTDNSLTGYDVGGTAIVYGIYTPLISESDPIVLVDAESPESTRVLSETGADPTTDGRYVFWTDGSGWNDEWGWPIDEIYGYDISTHSYLGHAFNPNGSNHSAKSSEGVVVWWLWEPNTSVPKVEVREISDILPSVPRPDPGKTDPAWLYFDKTGHYLSYGFKDFWLNSGGLPVFGYPLTREYDELNRDLGEYRTVQYTERQRYEYHPAYAGTPYETLLGRLGAADADRRELDDHPAFAPVDKSTSAGVDYFSATGHTLRGPFRDYWHNHGLEFGDAGVSYRESLALFGYPISEEFVDPDTGLVTQYFERAVFEHHPDNPDPYKVLLRRLGAEEIDNRAW
jgi:hypothetical protein